MTGVTVKKRLFAVIILLLGFTVLPGYGSPSSSMPQKGYTKAVPAAYFSPAEKQGVLNEMYYNSSDYSGNGGTVSKKAWVYLPYGYNGNDIKKRYNIVYLMHGLGETADSLFGYGGGTFKNILDNMIQRGETEPVIVVAPTFDTENRPQDMRRSDSEVRQFHKEFLNDLMPAVEAKYHTNAMGTTKAQLAASRDHRAFGGFSLGAVTTWFEFCYNSDYIKYFLPMSCSCWYYGGYGDYHPVETCDFLEKTVRDNRLDAKGYFVYACTGTNDVEQGQVDLQMNEMLKRPAFSSPENVLYYKKNGGIHDSNAGFEYVYNALPLFFKELTEKDAEFYDIYSNFEKLSDDFKADTGLYYFKGNPGERFVICVEGPGSREEFFKGEGFYNAYELSKKGYNAFALRYRAGDRESCEDLARAIACVIENAGVLGVKSTDYILWGGASGLKTVMEVNKSGTARYGAGDYPKAASVIR